MNLNQMGEGIQVASLASMGSRDAPVLSTVPRRTHTQGNARAAAHASRSVLEAELLPLKVAVPRVPVAKWVNQPNLRR